MKIRRLTDTGEWTTRRYLSLLGSILIWAIVAIDAWYLWPTQLHGSTSMVIVSGHSMEPTYFTGDLVIARKTEPSVGDVIVYAPVGLGGSQIVHRIIGGNATDGWQMQGDNNNFVDPFTPKGAEVKGVVLVHYANFGRVTVLLLNPIVWAFVLLAAIVLLLWWGGDECEDDPEDDDDKDDAGADGPAEPRAGSRIDGTHPSDAPLEEDPSAPGVPEAGALPAPAYATALQPVRAEANLVSKPARAIAATMVGLLALAFSVTPAAASKLNVVPAGEASVASLQKCGAQSLATVPSGTHTGNAYRQVTVSGIAPTCLSKPIIVYVHNGAGAVIATFTGTTPATGSTMTLSLAPVGATFDASQANKVVAKVNGWLFMSSWTSPTAPFVQNCVVTRQNGSTSPCTLTVSSVSRVFYNNSGLPFQEVDISVTFPAGSQAIYWTADINFAAVPGVSVTPAKVGMVWNWLAAPAGCAAYPQVSVRSDDYQFSGTVIVGNPESWRPILCP